MNCWTLVVICFHFTIFVVLETTASWVSMCSHGLWFAFILLSLSYWKQHQGSHFVQTTGVICFHFTIFVVLETTILKRFLYLNSLWFAFILLSLSYWKQHRDGYRCDFTRCDLLSFYYLCRTGNNWQCAARRSPAVVICFHFTIFVVLETTW